MSEDEAVCVRGEVVGVMTGSAVRSAEEGDDAAGGGLEVKDAGDVCC